VLEDLTALLVVQVGAVGVGERVEDVLNAGADAGFATRLLAPVDD